MRDPHAATVERLREWSNGKTPGRCVILPCDLTDTSAAAQALNAYSTELVCSCVASRSGSPEDSWAVEYGANRVLLDWALEKQVRHFTLLSAICVQKPRLAFQFAKLKFESALQNSGLAHSIVRPTAFFKSLSGQLKRVNAGKAFMVFGDGQLTRCKPIGEADLAAFIRGCMEDSDGKQPRNGIQAIGGPGAALTPLDQVKIIEELTGKPVTVRRVPPGLLSGVARTLALPGRWLPALAAKAEYARIGHYYATESMLLWDPISQRYDADATPSFGTRCLRDSYRDQLDGNNDQGLGEHGFF